MKMGIALIVVGVILVGAGIFMVVKDSKPEEAVEQMVSRAPQERNVVGADKTQEKSSKEKGNDFEGYVVDLLSASGVSLKEWNQGTTSPGGTYAENELKPDLFISDSKGSSSLEYWVECKYQSRLAQTGFEIEEYQLNRYKKYQGSSRKKVLLAVGIGGESSAPERLYMVPLDSLSRYKHIPQRYLDKYEVTPHSRLSVHIRDYFFNEVFDKK